MSNFPEDKVIYRTSTVSDGNMSFKFGESREVLDNRKRFLEKIGVPLDRCVGINLVHGMDILKVNEDDMSRLAVEVRDGDALVTERKDVFLFMMTADCVPVVIYDPIKSVIALVHCGWKSTDGKLLEKAVQLLTGDYGCDADNLIVFIGPCIHRKSFKFENPIQKTLPGWEKFLNDLEDGETEIDLVGYNVSQLERSGILSKNINVSPVDTAKNKEYFSHYRSVRNSDDEGRFCTVVGMLN